MAEGTGEGYYRAYAAIVYAAELLGYYSDFASDSGLADLAETSKQEQESALALADAAYQLAADSGYFTQVAESVASSEADTAETVPETSAQPSTDASTNENTDANETAASDATTPSSAASSETISVEVPTAATVTGIEACYQGGIKYVGDVVYTAELFVRVSYSDGTVKDVYDGWYSPQVGMTLKQEGYNTVTMYYGDFSSNLEVYANPAPVQPTETPAAVPTETAPAQTETAAPAPTETQAPAPTETQAPAPTETQAPAPTETQAPAPTETQAPTPTPTPSATGQSIVDYAMQWVGQCNYVWGGTNLTPGGGVDCSGFTMNVYAAFGISLPHYSGAQLNYGQAVSYEQLQPGDLICFSGHVGIYIGGGMMVHAASETRGIVVDNVFYNKQPIGYRRLV